jgi:hypothetical protein
LDRHRARRHRLTRLTREPPLFGQEDFHDPAILELDGGKLTFLPQVLEGLGLQAADDRLPLGAHLAEDFQIVAGDLILSGRFKLLGGGVIDLEGDGIAIHPHDLPPQGLGADTRCRLGADSRRAARLNSGGLLGQGDARSDSGKDHGVHQFAKHVVLLSTLMGNGSYPGTLPG